MTEAEEAFAREILEHIHITKHDISFAKAFEIIVEAMDRAHVMDGIALEKLMDQCNVRYCEEQEKFIDSTDGRTGWDKSCWQVSVED